MEINESVDCAEEAVDVICEVVKEDNDKDNDVCFIIAITTLAGGSVLSLWVIWDLIVLVWGE